MIKLNAHEEWRAHGGFHAMCHAHHLNPRVASLVQQRQHDGTRDSGTCHPLAGQPVWIRSRIQGSAQGPMRWITSWMPAVIWDSKFGHISNSGASESSFEWGNKEHRPAFLTIHREWGIYVPGSADPWRDWGSCLPAFRQTVWTDTNICWEFAQAVLNPCHWTGVPMPQTVEDLMWTYSS